jgi:hypothetical protein
MFHPIGGIYLKEVRTLLICENANLKFAEPFKKHFSKQNQPTCFHGGVFGHIRPHCPQIQHQQPQIRKIEQKTGKSSSKPSKPHHAFRQQRHFLKGVLPLAVNMVSMATPRPNASE